MENKDKTIREKFRDVFSNSDAWENINSDGTITIQPEKLREITVDFFLSHLLSQVEEMIRELGEKRNEMTPSALGEIPDRFSQGYNVALTHALTLLGNLKSNLK